MRKIVEISKALLEKDHTKKVIEEICYFDVYLNQVNARVAIVPYTGLNQIRFNGSRFRDLSLGEKSQPFGTPTIKFDAKYSKKFFRCKSIYRLARRKTHEKLIKITRKSSEKFSKILPQTTL